MKKTVRYWEDEQENLILDYINGQAISDEVVLATVNKISSGVMRKWEGRMAAKFPDQTLLADLNYQLFTAVKKFDVNKKKKVYSYLTRCAENWIISWVYRHKNDHKISFMNPQEFPFDCYTIESANDLCFADFCLSVIKNIESEKIIDEHMRLKCLVCRIIDEIWDDGIKNFHVKFNILYKIKKLSGMEDDLQVRAILDELFAEYKSGELK
jgi:hypothetical protein